MGSLREVKVGDMEKLDFTVDEWRVYRLERGECWPPEGFNARLRRIVDDVLARE